MDAIVGAQCCRIDFYQNQDLFFSWAPVGQLSLTMRFSEPITPSLVYQFPHWTTFGRHWHLQTLWVVQLRDLPILTASNTSTSESKYSSAAQQIPFTDRCYCTKAIFISLCLPMIIMLWLIGVVNRAVNQSITPPYYNIKYLTKAKWTLGNKLVARIKNNNRHSVQ